MTAFAWMDQTKKKHYYLRATTLAEIQTFSSLIQVGRNAILTYRFSQLARYIKIYIYRMFLNYMPYITGQLS